MLTFEPITPQSAPRMRPYYADCSYHLCEYSVGVKLNASVSRVDDETVIRMVGHGLGITMMTELMIRGRTDDVLCVPVEPLRLRELGMGTSRKMKLTDGMQSLKDCMLQFIHDRS